MPRVPTVVGRIATPALRAGATPQPRFPSSLAESGLRNVGDAIIELTGRLQAQEDARQLSELETQGIDRLEELEVEVLKDPEFSTATGRYNEGAVSIIDELGEKASNSRVRRALAQQLGRRSVFGTASVRKEGAKRSVVATRQSMGQSLEKWSAAFGRAGSDQERAFAMERARDTIGNALTSGAFESQEQAQTIFKDWLQSAERSRVMGMIERNEYAAAGEFVDQSKVLDDEQKISLRNFASNQQAAAQSAVVTANAQTVADLDIAIGRASTEDLSGLYEQAEALRSVMRPDKYAGFVKRLDVKRLKGYDDAKSQNRFLDVLQGNGVGYSSNKKEDRDAVEAGWLRVAATLEELNATEEQVFEQGLFVSSRTGIVPDMFRNLVNASLNDANNPDRAVVAAKFVAAVGRDQPRLAQQFSSKDIEYAVLLDTLHARGGIPAADAVKDARDAIFGSTDNTTRFRQKRWTSESMAETAMENLDAGRLNDLFPGARDTGFSAGLLAGLDPFGFFGTTAEHDRFLADYVTTVEAIFTRTGDLDAAQTAAGIRMQKTWGLSSVDGKPRIMFLAPEFSHPSGGMDEAKQTEWMREQWLDDAMQEGVGVLDFDLPADPKERREYLEENLEIITDAQTTGFPRSYSATVRDNLGIPRAVHNDEGSQWRWRPEFNVSREADRMERDEQIRREELGKKVSEAIARRGLSTGERLARKVRRSLKVPEEGMTALQRRERMPRGIRNNNPGNIESSDAYTWDGQSSQQTDERFAQFDTPKMGLRAMAKLLRNYQALYAIKTLDQITSRYEEQFPAQYAKSVAKQSGIKRDETLDLRNEALLLRLMKGMIQHENGQQPYDDKLILEAIGLAGIGMYGAPTGLEN